MYIPKEFIETNPDEILQFLEQNPLGMLISTAGLPEPMVSHIPFLIKTDRREIILEGHISRANSQAEQLKKGKPVLVVFQGPNTYISSSLYSHTNVPTWNYQAVHIYGTIETMETPELIQHLEESVQHFEDQRHQKLSFADFPEAMIEDYLKGICGIRIKAYKTEAAYKMSQNRNEKDYQNIVSDLAQSPASKDQQVANVMQAISNHKKR